MKFPFVSIILLTWNQCELTSACLASLVEMDYPSDKLNIIVVDNGSTDDTVDAIRLDFPQAYIVQNHQNLGFAEGNNVGLRQALTLQPDLVMLLNNDTVVDRLMLRQLIARMDSEQGCGIVGPKMLYYDPSDVIWAAGGKINWLTGESIVLESGRIDQQSNNLSTEVDFIVGCGIMLKREVIDEIGLLDQRFFIYYEEIDWCVRASDAGWQIIYEPTARLWHRISAAMGSSSPPTDYYMTRNAFLFVSKNTRGIRRLVPLIYLGARTMTAIAAYTIKSQGGNRIRNRDAKLYGLRDAILGRWGKMGKDVELRCTPGA